MFNASLEKENERASSCNEKNQDAETEYWLQIPLLHLLAVRLGASVVLSVSLTFVTHNGDENPFITYWL